VVRDSRELALPLVISDHGDLHVSDSLESHGVESFDASQFEYFDAEGRVLQPVINGYHVELILDPDVAPKPEHLRDLIQAYFDSVKRRTKDRSDYQLFVDEYEKCSSLKEAIDIVKRYNEYRDSRIFPRNVFNRRRQT
jgi:hypothetical protein